VGFGGVKRNRGLPVRTTMIRVILLLYLVSVQVHPKVVLALACDAAERGAHRLASSSTKRWVYY